MSSVNGEEIPSLENGIIVDESPSTGDDIINEENPSKRGN